MATAKELRTELTCYLDKEDYLYDVVNEEKDIISLSFSASSFGDEGVTDTTIFIDFDDDGASAHFAIHFPIPVKAEKKEAILDTVNEQNKSLRWARTFMDEDGVFIDCDQNIHPGTAADDCFVTAVRLGSIAQSIYSALMKTVFA